jgi:heme/copper-type cytochrome/quinol oxidase subunit 2
VGKARSTADRHEQDAMKPLAYILAFIVAVPILAHPVWLLVVIPLLVALAITMFVLGAFRTVVYTGRKQKRSYKEGK